MLEAIKVSDRDYLAKFKAVVDALNQAGNPLNPIYQSFGGAWKIPDMRPNKRRPQDYPGFSSGIEFNEVANLDYVPANNAGYGYVLTVAGYDSAGIGGGGLPVQLGFGAQMSVRVGTSASTWSPWKRLASYDDQTAQFGNKTTGQNVLISGDNTTIGAALLIQTGGSSIMALGNKSALLGGGFDNTPFIFSPIPVSTYSGFNFGGMISAKGQAELLRLSHSQGYISMYPTAGENRSAYIQASTGESLAIMAEANHLLKFGSNGSFQMVLDLGGNLIPANDAVKYNGTAASRWAAVYAATGAIQTSDARKKTDVQKLTPAMKAAAREMLGLIGTYQWLQSIEDKGEDKARLHIGFTVQQAISILEKHEIDPFKVAFICYDKWDAEYENRCINEGEKVIKLRIVQKQKMRLLQQPQDAIELINGKPVLVQKVVEVAEPIFEELPVQREDGSLVMLDENTPMLHRVPVFETVQEPYEAEAEPKYEKVLVREAGDCFAFRYDQLTLFMLSALAE